MQPGLSHLAAPGPRSRDPKQTLERAKAPSFPRSSRPRLSPSNNAQLATSLSPRTRRDIRYQIRDNSNSSLDLRIFLNTTVTMGDTAKASSPLAKSVSPARSLTKSPTNPASSPIHDTVPLVADEVMTHKAPPSFL